MITFRGGYIKDWFLFSDKIGAQFCVASASLLWGVLLMFPEDTMALPRFAFMAKIGSDYAWGFSFLLSAALQFATILFFIGIRFRCFAGLYAATLHAVAACNFWYVNYPSLAVGTASEVAVVITAVIAYLFTPADQSRHGALL